MTIATSRGLEGYAIEVDEELSAGFAVEGALRPGSFGAGIGHPEDISQLLLDLQAEFQTDRLGASIGGRHGGGEDLGSAAG